MKKILVSKQLMEQVADFLHSLWYITEQNKNCPVCVCKEKPNNFSSHSENCKLADLRNEMCELVDLSEEVE